MTVEGENCELGPRLELDGRESPHPLRREREEDNMGGLG